MIFALLISVALSLPGTAAVFTPQPVETPLANDPLQVTVHRLPNGLTVYLSPNRQEPRVTAWVVVRAGSKQDSDDSTGLAHYLEHMLFKGTARLSTLDYDKEKPHLDRISQLYEQLFHTKDPDQRKAVFSQIDRENIQASRYAVPNELDKLYKALGFRGVNAFTSDEKTVFVCNFPSNRAEVWARLEADRFSHAVFRLFESELETVYEEKNRTMDNAEEILDEALQKQVYKVHPYGQHTTIGTIEHLKNPSLAKMYEFHRTYYRPNNMALVLSGDFDEKALMDVIQKYFGDWKPAPLPSAKKWALPKPKGTERIEVKYEAEEKVEIAWPTVANKDSDVEPLEVMDMLMDNSQAGILNLRLNQAQKVKSSGSYPSLLNDAGEWVVWAVPKKDQSLSDAEALLMESVGKLLAGEFTEQDIRAVLTDFEVNEKMRLESNDSRVARMADSFVDFEEWAHAADRLNRLRRVTKEDVLRVARKYLGPNRVVARRANGKPLIPSIQKPNFTEIPIDPSRKSAFYRELLSMPAKPLEPKWLEAGRDYEVLASTWGGLIAAHNPMNDLFQITFHFDRGYRQERDLCAALDLLELAGAGKLDAETYKKTLYGMGTRMDVSCGEDESNVALSGLDKNFEASLRMMSERFEDPSIATDTLKKMVEVEISRHADAKKDPNEITEALGEYAMRGRNSSVLAELSDSELRSLQEPALRKLISSAFGFQRDALYAGIRNGKDVMPALSFGQSAFKPVAPRQPRRYLRPERPRVLFVHRDMVQSLIGVYAADTVFDPGQVVNYKFYRAYMGGMSGVFFQEVREARALAYSVGGGYAMGRRKGDENLVEAEAGCQADKTPETATLLGALIDKMPASADRFAEAFKAMEENYRAGVIPFRQIPGAVLHWRELGLDGDPRPAEFQKALKYTLDDLTSFAGRFESEPLTFYILGNKPRVDSASLKPLGDFDEVPLDALFPY